jgi:hypothetical protein
MQPHTGQAKAAMPNMPSLRVCRTVHPGQELVPSSQLNFHFFTPKVSRLASHVPASSDHHNRIPTQLLYRPT